MGVHPTAAESTEISAQNAQPCCWSCNILTVKEGEWSLEVQSSRTQDYFIACCLGLWQLIPKTSIFPLKNPKSSFLPWSPYGLCMQVSPVQAQVLCIPSSTTSNFVRGCPHLWKQKEVYPDHTVVFFEHLEWFFSIFTVLKRWGGWFLFIS